MTKIITPKAVPVNAQTMIDLYNLVSSLDVRQIVKLTQAQYDALYAKDEKTIYLIVNP